MAMQLSEIFVLFAWYIVPWTISVFLTWAITDISSDYFKPRDCKKRDSNII